MVVSALGDRFFNVFLSILCGALSVVNDVFISIDRIASSVVHWGTEKWEDSFVHIWDSINAKFGRVAEKEATDVERLRKELHELRTSAKMLPIQNMLGGLRSVDDLRTILRAYG